MNTHLHHISVYTHVHILCELSIDESWVTNVECVYTLMHDTFVAINWYIYECVYTHTLFRHTYLNHMYGTDVSYLHTYVCIHACVYTQVCVYTYVCIHACVYTHVCIHICVYLCVRVYTYDTSMSIHVVYIRVSK